MNRQRGETLIAVLLLLAILCAVGSVVTHPNVLVEVEEEL